MADFILLMHDDTQARPPAEMWDAYFTALNAQGVFEGGSAIGGGVAMNKAGAGAAVSYQIAGYIRVSARDLDHAKSLVAGNPVFECGGTVEVRALPRD